MEILMIYIYMYMTTIFLHLSQNKLIFYIPNFIIALNIFYTISLGNLMCLYYILRRTLFS